MPKDPARERAEQLLEIADVRIDGDRPGTSASTTSGSSRG